MTDYQAEMDRILAEYTAASRTVREQFIDADERTTRGGTDVFASLREELARSEQEQQHPEETKALEERDRLLRETAERARQRRLTAEHGRETYVLPSDWTEEDEAREEGYGQPKSWLV
ncbi:hypothetical protein [Nocardia terpenica]|uniref:Uncharacterized protein n=1 Tax=Nocardia terpenica TaxID=455432 RepID=A0A0U1YZD1_9NOCA|nr:hypothetical protein [Nocardia terpenica]AJO72777.1 hypothetical protein [Nocardia terpenica]KZM75394.1 hypothetical protein AWN90_18590 [Nocardia terpenica]NQE85860.1 hypothetical protein [Nocardia terpenica]BBE00877.1 hypothetical protein [Nocardia terpenica]